MSTAPLDYDSPRKEALERYFKDFMAFFFPTAHAGIDWTRGYEFLDKELQRVVRDAELGRRLVDKLVRVWRLEGEEAWVMIHIEVQGQMEEGFAKRMYIYHYRLFDRYDRPVVSLAVLGDERPTWRPEGYGYGLWGCQVRWEDSASSAPTSNKQRRKPSRLSTSTKASLRLIMLSFSGDSSEISDPRRRLRHSD
jgi:hypothetical protein